MIWTTVNILRFFDALIKISNLPTFSMAYIGDVSGSAFKQTNLGKRFAAEDLYFQIL